MMTKKILNQQNKSKKESNDTVKSESIKIENYNNTIFLSVNKEWALKQGAHELTKSLLLTLSPLFLNQNSTTKQSSQTHNKGFKHIAFFMEQMPHYTGGRYSIFHQAVLLSMFTKVTFYTNEKPVFYDDFKDYITPNFQLNIDNSFGLNSSETDVDLVIGAPVVGGHFAYEYSNKFELPYYLILFESPNWISTMREGTDASEDFWKGYKRILGLCDKIITPSHESKKWTKEWIGRDDISVIYPCLNQIVADEVKNNDFPKLIDSSKVKIFYSARATQFKNPFNLIKKLDRNKFSFHLVGKLWSRGKESMEQLKKDGYEIHNYGAVNDKTKFRILKECDAMMFPTKFEGFGMPPQEALYFNKPVVTYELPVLKEIYGDKLIYAKDEDDFVYKMNNLSYTKTQPENFSEIRQCVERLLDVVNIPKISTGTIVYRGGDYLEYAIKSIYHLVWKIIVVNGAIKGYDESDIFDDNETQKIVEELKKSDVLNKISFHKFSCKFDSKIQLQNEIAKRVEGKYYIKIDHDEIWKPKTLIKAVKIMEQNPQTTILKMPFLHFWLSFWKVAKDAGGKWSAEHPRVWRWNKDFRHKKSFNYFKTSDNVPVSQPFYKELKFIGDEEDVIYHFGWARSLDKLLEKIKYYKNRGIEKYVIDTITDWNDNSDLTQPTQNVNSWAEDFTGNLPKILKKHPYYNVKDLRKLNE